MESYMVIKTFWLVA